MKIENVPFWTGREVRWRATPRNWLVLPMHTQAEADEQLVKLLSVEPDRRDLVRVVYSSPTEPISLAASWDRYIKATWEWTPTTWYGNLNECPNCEAGRREDAAYKCEVCHGTCWVVAEPYVHGVIVAGQVGENAKPLHPDRVRKLRDECKTSGVPFFFVGWGDWAAPFDGEKACEVCGCTEYDACPPVAGQTCWWIVSPTGPRCSRCEGKPLPQERAVKFRHLGYTQNGNARAGRKLDRKTHNKLPKGGSA